MRKGRSTSKPTKAEEAYIVACKGSPCRACEVLRQDGLDPPMDNEGCDFQHMKSGNIRMGHMYGYALCTWHHRRIPFDGWTPKQMAAIYGPSLMDGGKAFAAAYGTEQELLDRQRRYLEGV